MKNLFKVICLLFVAIVLISCNRAALSTDEMDKFVVKLDAVLDTQTRFHEETVDFKTGNGGQIFMDSFDSFETAYQLMDEHYNSLNFDEKYQQVSENYSNSYRPFLEKYIEKISEVVEEMKKSKPDVEVLADYFGDLDKLSDEFLKVHDEFVAVFDKYFTSS